MLLLLLQSFAHYVDNVTSNQSIPPSKTVGPSMSIGLVVKKYWNSMLKLGSLYQQTMSEKNSASDTVSKLQAKVANLKVKNEQLKSCPSTMSDRRASLNSIKSATSSQTQSMASETGSLVPSAYGIAKDTRNVGSQTVESELVPCDACARTQACLTEVSNAIIGICRSQNLPSSLSRFQEAVQVSLGSGALCATDMVYWVSEQSKDLNRINKHLTELMNTINPLKAELKILEEAQVRLEKQVENFNEELQKEKDKQMAKLQQVENTMEEKKKQNLETVTKLEKDKEELRKGAAVVEERVSILKEELKAQHVHIRDLEVTKETLLEEMRTKMTEKSVVITLEERIKTLASQLESMNQHLSSTSMELEKEKAKLESMQRHEESLQAKQKALLQRVDALDQECEELRESLDDAQDEKALVEEQLAKLQEEKTQIKDQFQKQMEKAEELQLQKQQLEQSVSELRKNINDLEGEIQEQKERERLLVAFPDLNIPQEAQFESSSNIAVDMEKQLQANNIRINILVEENARLRNSLSKLRAKAQHGSLKLIPQTQLWSSSRVFSEEIRPQSGHSKKQQENAEGPSAGSKSSSKYSESAELGKYPVVTTLSRPQSGLQEKTPQSEVVRTATAITIPPEGSAVSTYIKLKKAGGFTGIRITPSGVGKDYKK
nr:PREDICTED: coiled-coil domain-containing protein 157 isoform X2 [Latimeria chalumnae]|eukprot:XP_014352972.1 PREDICTED: coiled-coil domain-containing protein 157 isoform X2 [Latimeria chalumnae]